MKLRFTAESLLAVFVCLLACGTAQAAPPDEDADPLLSDLARGWTRTVSPLPARQGLASGPGTRADALAALQGGRKPDTRCATSLLLALYQQASRLNAPTRTLVEQLGRAPVTSAGAAGSIGGSVKMSAGGEFRIHYRTELASVDRVEPNDGDLNGVPDGVDRLAAELTDELADFVHVLGWPPRPSLEAAGGSTAIDVYLVGELGGAGGAAGFVMPRGSGWGPMAAGAETPEGADSSIYLASSLASAKAVSRDAIAHMIAHVILMRESAREAPWWHESTATWLENRLHRNAQATASSFASASPRRTRGLTHDVVGLGLEAFLWPHYLSQSLGADATLLRRMWEEMAAVPGNNTFEAMDRVLRRAAGTTLTDEIRLFNIWNIFLGQSDDGRHYPFASLLPTPQGDAVYELFPVRGSSLSGPVLPLGSALVRLLGDGSQGGLRIRFFGAEPGDWDIALLVYSAGRPAEVRHVQLEVDASGRGFIPVPWRGLAALDLLIQNLAPATASPAEYYFSIDYDPAVPYDLLGFSAEDSGGQATLAWSTDSEERLAGWNIWRGAGPLGPFSRINRYLVPGAGRSDSPVSYFFVDTSVDPGRKYYYQLEGVTLEGFTEKSHPTGVRIAKRPVAQTSTPQ